EDKEGVFDACDTVKMCLKVLTPMLESMQVNTGNMLLAAQKGFINATDLADYLVKKGLPFRSAYKLSGQIVAKCIAENTVLEDLPLESYKAFSPLFEADLYGEIDLITCVRKRISQGSTGPASVKAQLTELSSFLASCRS
ncbi:MAG: argininosuccinate lyase, partial [Clostridia bacterium]|nr:argininosuccinate lyase [Clostridia bacterium]